jgi:hypothetical protein
VHPQPRTQHSASPAGLTFFRELVRADLDWAVKKAIDRAVRAGFDDVEQLCDRVAELAAERVTWAEKDGDDERLRKWRYVAKVMGEDRRGYVEYVARRAEWLCLSGEAQQELLEASRKPPTAAQIRYISRLGGDVHVEDRWEATRLIDRLLRERDK